MNRLVLLLISITYCCLAIAQPKTLPYRGWKNCYLLENEFIKAIISPESGGRVLYFGNNKENLLYVDTMQNGFLLSENLKIPFDPDAGRFDFGPEVETASKHAQTWMGKWKIIKISSNALTLSSIPDSGLGLQTERTFTLKKRSASLIIKQSSKNISKENLTRHYWSRTLVLPGGLVQFTANSTSRFKNKWACFLNRPRRIYTDTIDKRITVTNNQVQFTSKGPTFKFGADVKKGKLNYLINNLIFTKEFKTSNLKKYNGSDQMSLIFYHCSKFLEIEPVSKTYTLKPGQEFSFTETWTLH